MKIELLDATGVVIGKVVFYQEFNYYYTKHDDIEELLDEVKFKISSNEGYVFGKMNIKE